MLCLILRQRDFHRECKYDVVDTLSLARRNFPELENHKLNTVANHLDIEHLNHHRAMGDAKATAQIFIRCMKKFG